MSNESSCDEQSTKKSAPPIQNGQRLKSKASRKRKVSRKEPSPKNKKQIIRCRKNRDVLFALDSTFSILDKKQDTQDRKRQDKQDRFIYLTDHAGASPIISILFFVQHRRGLAFSWATNRFQMPSSSPPEDKASSPRKPLSQRTNKRAALILLALVVCDSFGSSMVVRYRRILPPLLLGHHLQIEIERARSA